ncbi:hypothetical protein [Leifsonia sp. 22587]|uniref:hypothetical protein n=1 Tax=Leifsonia sp. 22587 TaxID=3453946 RepID=UPI003F87640F
MSIATRTARPNGATRTRVTAGAVAMDPALPRRDGRRDGPHDAPRPLPVVVIDLPRVAHRFRELRAALPWMDVRFDACALAHPALLASLAADGAGFVATHESALPVLQRTGVDPARVLHADRWARGSRRRDAWEAGVRLFVIDDARDLDDFAGAPAGVAVLLRLHPLLVDEAESRAHALGVRVAGLSLRLPGDASSAHLLDTVDAAMAARARIARSTGRRLGILDLGPALDGPPTAYPHRLAALGRSIRSLVAPATSQITVLASAGRGVAADAITLVTGTAERYADPATASALIDAGAEVVVLRARRRIPRPAKARSTWTSAG